MCWHCIALPTCRRQLALVSKDEDRKQARIQQLEESAESLKREMKDHEGTPAVHYSSLIPRLECGRHKSLGTRLILL